MGSSIVCLLLYLRGPSLRNGIDSIARTIDSKTDFALFFPFSSMNVISGSGLMDKSFLVDAVLKSPAAFERTTSSPITASSLSSTSPSSSASPSPSTSSPTSSTTTSGSGAEDGVAAFDPLNQLFRLATAVATLGSGCSLGPEGPSVEIGAGISRLLSGVRSNTTLREKHHLFLAGTAAGVSAGFNAPIAGIFFAIECGNRYLSKNTIRLDEDSPDGPRADIAAIVLAAALSNLVVAFGLQHADALSIQGNEYAMVSPLFELPLYMGLGLVSGAVAVAFTKLRDHFSELFRSNPLLSSVPSHFHPLFGGLLCGVTAVFYPQTLFVGYFILDQLLAGHIQLGMPLLMQLLSLKLLLSSFSLGSGLTGGVFAPSLFFGAVAGTAYHNLITSLLEWASKGSTAWTGPASDLTDFSSHPLTVDAVDAIMAAMGPSGPLTVPSMVQSLTNGNTGVVWSLTQEIISRLDLVHFFNIAGAPAYATGNKSTYYIVNRYCFKYMFVQWGLLLRSERCSAHR